MLTTGGFSTSHSQVGSGNGDGPIGCNGEISAGAGPAVEAP